jgi:hypothetical protein
MPLRKRQVGFQQDEDDDDDVRKASPTNLEALNSQYTKLDKNGVHAPHASSLTKPLVVAPKRKVSLQLLSLSVMVHGWLQAYTKFTSSAGNQDKALKTLQYTLWWIGRFHHHGNASSSLGRPSVWTTVSGEISWARYLHRWFGLPAAVEAARSGSWGSPGTSTTSTLLGKGMAYSMMAYYPLEYVAYLKWKVPQLQLLSLGRRNHQHPKQHDHRNMGEDRLAAQASAWSCRFWLAYILMDIVRSTLALQNMNMKETSSSTDDNDDSQEHANANGNANGNVQARRSEQLQIVRNVLFTVPAIHWSLPKWDTDPWLSSDLLNGLVWLESIVCIYQGIDNFKASSAA